jgi:uncharacterized membrane protein YhaH (DUF805 family)
MEARDGSSQRQLLRISQLREFFRTRHCSEFWYWVLFVLASIAGGLIDIALFGLDGSSAIESPVGLALFLPGLAVSVRRLHDLDRSGWWVLLGLIPRRDWHTIIWNWQRGTIGPNRFGPDPPWRRLSGIAASRCPKDERRSARPRAVSCLEVLRGHSLAQGRAWHLPHLL